MEYKAKGCAVCGSDKLKLVSHKSDGTNVFYTYRCDACGEVFSTEAKYLKKQEKLKRQAEKEAAKKAKETQKASLRVAAADATNEETAPLSAQEIFKKNRKYVVEIKADFGNGYSCGTGIVVGGGYVLSNAHVVFAKRARGRCYAANDIMCKDSLQNIFHLDLICADIKKDMVLLHTDDLDKSGVTFTSRAVETGERVYAIGNSKGQGICILDGIVSDSERIIMGEKYIMFSAPIVHGNSGGPVFNCNGIVIGIATLGRGDALAMNYAIPVSVVKNFMEKAKNEEEVDIALKFTNHKK